jgi:hypothetical protein
MQSVLASDGLPAKPLHTNCTTAKDSPLHVHTAPAAGCSVRLRVCTNSVSQDGLSGAPPGYASNQVTVQSFACVLYDECI